MTQSVLGAHGSLEKESHSGESVQRTWTCFSSEKPRSGGINCVVGGGEEGTGRVNYEAPAMPVASTFPKDLQHK